MAAPTPDYRVTLFDLRGRHLGSFTLLAATFEDDSDALDRNIATFIRECVPTYPWDLLNDTTDARGVRFADVVDGASNRIALLRVRPVSADARQMAEAA